MRSENLRKAFLSKFRQVLSLAYEKNESKTHAKKKQNILEDNCKIHNYLFARPVTKLLKKVIENKDSRIGQ